MKTPKERFEEYYTAVNVPSDNKKGFKIKYIYYGPWYRWNVAPAVLKRSKWLTGVFCALGIALFFAAAVQQSVLNYSGSVVIPSMLSAAVLIFEVIGVVQFLLAKEKIAMPDYQNIDRKLRAATVLRAALLFLAAVFGVNLSIRNALPVSEAMISLGYFLSGGLSLLIFFIYRRMPFSTEENSVIHEQGISVP